ncbi:MAG: hypothetical protein ABI376_00045 [Caulobacteraceae bacterium]
MNKLMISTVCALALLGSATAVSAQDHNKSLNTSAAMMAKAPTKPMGHKTTAMCAKGSKAHSCAKPAAPAAH